MSETYRYRVLKSTWGIAIDLTAEPSFPSSAPDAGLIITEGLWLDVHSPSVTAEDQKWLVSGLRKIAKYFQNKPLREHKFIVVTVSNLEISLSDFQPEGLAEAIIRWAAKVFALDVPETNISFDKPNNKYIFDFSPLEGR